MPFRRVRGRSRHALPSWANEIWGWVVSAVMVLAMCLPVSFSVNSTCCIRAHESDCRNAVITVCR